MLKTKLTANFSLTINFFFKFIIFCVEINYHDGMFVFLQDKNSWVSVELFFVVDFSRNFALIQNDQEETNRTD